MAVACWSLWRRSDWPSPRPEPAGIRPNLCAHVIAVWLFFSGAWSGAAWRLRWWAWPGSVGSLPVAGNLGAWLNAGQIPLPRTPYLVPPAPRRAPCPAPGAAPTRWSRGWIGWWRPGASWWMGFPAPVRVRARPRAPRAPRSVRAPAWASWAAGWRTSSTGFSRRRTTGGSPGRSPARSLPPRSLPRGRPAPLPDVAPWRPFRGDRRLPDRRALLPHPLLVSTPKTGPMTPASAGPAGNVPGPRPA